MFDRAPLAAVSRWRLGAALLSAAALTIAGCANGNSDLDEGSSPAPTESIETQDSPAPEHDDSDSSNVEQLIAAGKLVMDKVKGTKVVSIEVESNDEWEVKVAKSDGNQYEAYVSPDGKKITRKPRNEHEDSEDRGENVAELQGAKLDYAEAARVMVKEVPGDIDELDLDTENGRVVWEADVIDAQGVKHEITIDAGDGSVIKNKVDD